MLMTRPDTWDSVDATTHQNLTELFLADCDKTTPATAAAALVTTLGLVLTEGFPATEWGPLSYDCMIRLQTAMLQLLAAPAAPAPVDAPPADPAPPVAEPLVGGVGKLPEGR